MRRVVVPLIMSDEIATRSRVPNRIVPSYSSIDLILASASYVMREQTRSNRWGDLPIYILTLVTCTYVHNMNEAGTRKP